MPNLTGWHALVLLVIVVLLFGANKLPALAKSVGQSMKIFKNEVKGAEPPVPAADPSSSNATGSTSDTSSTSSTSDTTKSANTP